MSQFGALPLTQPQPVPQPTGVEIFDMAEHDRVEYMRALGARNVDPPRPRSSHLKIIANGRVLPWEELLAEQTELVVNCDAEGNTDPAAWMPSVDQRAYDPAEKQEMLVRAQATVLAQAQGLTDTHRSQDAVDAATPLPVDYPAGVVSLADVDKLSAMLGA